MDPSFLQHFHKFYKYFRCSSCIVHCPVMIFQRNIQGLCHNIQFEPGQSRQKDPGHRHRIHRSEIRLDSLTAAVLLNKTDIKRCVMSYQSCVPHKGEERRQSLFNPRCINNHGISDTGKLSDPEGNRHSGVYKGTESVCNFPFFHFHCTDLYNFV